VIYRYVVGGKSAEFSEEVTTSIFTFKLAKQDTCVEAGGKLSNWMVRNIRVYREQDGSGRVGPRSHGLVRGQNETAELSHDHKKGDVCWS
jgi:hypothetical protein